LFFVRWKLSPAFLRATGRIRTTQLDFNWQHRADAPATVPVDKSTILAPGAWG
jgi:hypothetical protein